MHDICVNDFVFIEEKHPLSIFAPGYSLDVELAVIHVERALQNDSIFPEKNLLAATYYAKIVLFFVPFYHLHLAAQRYYCLDFKGRNIPNPDGVRHVIYVITYVPFRQARKSS
jgi:hypothetical protein